MITFKECQSPGYRARTMDNASADITIAIAKDFTTAGERLTRSCVLLQHKIYIPVNYDNMLSEEVHYQIFRSIEGKINLNINIAGNGIYTIKESQDVIDLKVYKLLHNIYNDIPITGVITLIRSGGQTGIDEAGLKAAVKLGIPALCLAPKGWIFRDINGKDISNEEQFKVRFK